MKKMVALLLAGALAFGLMACSSGGQTKEPAETSEAEKADDGETASNGKRIFMSAAYYAAPYGAPLMSAVEARCKELGYEVQIVDGEENADKQLTQFKTAVADGFDALIYWPGDSASTPPVVEYLNSTGLPWVDINTVPDDSILDQCTIIASDEVQIGRELGKLMVQYAEENQLEENMNVVYIEGASGSSYTIHLTEGIEEILADYPNIKILNDHQYANFDPSTAMNIMDDMITKFGDDIDLVVAQDGGMFEGAYNAVSAAGKLGKYGLLCQGQDLVVKEKLESGELFATVAQDPFQEGTLAVDVLDKIIKGEETEAWTYTPTGPIFVKDIDGYSWF